MLKGFKDFISRGNVVELSVAVVVGTAFTAIVTAFTKGVIKPIINSFGGTNAAQGLGFRVLHGNPSTFVDIGTVINTAINFLIVAAVVYFIFVLPMNKLRERRKRGEEPGPADPADIELLREIRDLLKQQREEHGAPNHGAPNHGAPNHGAPNQGPPNYGPSNYGPASAPNHGAPNYGASGSSNHGAPNHGAPDYGQRPAPGPGTAPNYPR